MRRGIVASLCLLLAGCTFSAPQVESAMRWVRMFTSGDSAVVSQHSVWLASIGDYGAVLAPYTAEKFIVFANSSGDAIAFDGWIVRSVTGFGLGSPLTIVGREGERLFISGDTESAITCDPWIWSNPVWRQRCDLGSSEIVLNAEGNIQKISMSLGEKLGFVTLRVAN